MVKIFSKKESVADIYEILEDDGIVIVADDVMGEKVTELEEYIENEEDFNDDLFSSRVVHDEEDMTYLYLGNKLKGSVAKKLVDMTFEAKSEEEEGEDKVS